MAKEKTAPIKRYYQMRKEYLGLDKHHTYDRFLELAKSELLRSKSLSLSALLTNRKTSLIANVVTGKLAIPEETDD